MKHLKQIKLEQKFFFDTKSPEQRSEGYREEAEYTVEEQIGDISVRISVRIRCCCWFLMISFTVIRI